MKKLIIILMFLWPVLINAQTDSIKVSYSEERVESFEKTTLIDEYEKAFGSNKVIRSSLRVSLNGLTNIYLPIQLSNTGSFFELLNPILHFEQKIDIDKSILMSFSGNKSPNESVWNANIGLEGRWYYEMKKRINAGTQQANITGKYLGFRIGVNPYKYNAQVIDGSFFDAIMLRPTSSYTINWGWQFGNNVNFGLALGLKRGDKGIIDSLGQWITPKISGEKGSTLFLSTNIQAGFGLFFPLRKRGSGNYCDFLQCNYEVRKLLKFNLNNAFHLDRYNQNLKWDAAYERKLKDSPFSLNSGAVINFSSGFSYKIVDYQVEEVSDPVRGTIYVTHTEYSDKYRHSFGYGFQVEEQLRYYIGMQKRIREGKSASNLTGLYTAILANFKMYGSKYLHFYSDYTTDPSMHYVKDEYGRSFETNWGMTLGYQIQTNRNAFVDVSVSFLRKKPIYIPKNTFNKTVSVIDFSLKLGLAK